MYRQISPSLEHQLKPLITEVLSAKPTSSSRSRTYTDIVAITSNPELQHEAYSREASRLLDSNLTSYYRTQQEDEKELETRWAHRLLESTNPWGELRLHPYYSNYVSLVSGELQELASHDAIDFYGSGPLPFSACILATLLPHVTITCFDNDTHAVSLSSRLLTHLNQDSRVTAVWGVASLPSPKADVCVLAACVGETEDEKAAIVKTLLSTYKLVLARTTCGLATLHYPKVPSSVTSYATHHIQPEGPTINSTLVLSSDQIQL
jgi:hypothetical protein